MTTNRAARLVMIFSLFVLGLILPQAESQAPLSFNWSPAGQMTQARSGAAAVLLANGQVLITGGTDHSGIPQATTEVYNPLTGAFTAAPAMNVPRANHAAIVLKTGDVLVTGGLTAGGGYSDSAEIYSVSSQQWTVLSSSIGTGLAYHAMAQLSDGNVLIAGGTSTTKVVGSIVLYNLTNKTFTPIATMLTPRTNAVAAATRDGRVLIAGGTDINGAVLASTEIFVYSTSTLTGTVSAGPTMTSPRVGATATSTYDGVAVIDGNNGQNDLGTAEIFSQWTNTFQVVTGGTPRSQHFSALLPNNGGILVMGGTGGTAVDLLQPWANNKAGAFLATSASPVNLNEGFGSPASLGSLLAGGGMSPFASAAEVYLFPTISTDKSDYPPGTPVKMTGTGFQPFETVNLHLHEWVDQSTEDDPDATVTADALGNLSYGGYAPTPKDLGARYHLTAVGVSSGDQAQTIFTDGINSISFQNGSLDQPTAPATGTATAAECGTLSIFEGATGGYLPIYLSDSTATGTFYGSQANCLNGTTPITSFTPTSSATSIWYRNSATGSPELTACSVSGGLFTCELDALFGGAIFTSQYEQIYGAPTQLAFTTQPGGGAPGVAWQQQPVLAVEDANGNFVGNNSDSINLSISTNPATGTLTCTSNPLKASSGQAAFAGCSINNASASCYVLKATDTTKGFTATSSCFYISNPAVASKSTVSASPTSVQDNGTATSTITVTLKDVNGNAVVGKTVTVTANLGSSTISGNGVGVSNSSGVVTFTVTDTAPEAVTYTATDTTDNVQIGTATVTFVPGQVSAGNSTVTRTPTTVNADGTSISTITVTLNDSSGNPVPGETVTLSQGAGHSVITTVSGTTNSSGVATFTVTDTTVESVTYTAAYSGTYGTGTLTTHTVSVNFTGTATTLTLTVNPNSTTFGTSPIVLTSGLSVTSGGAPLGGVSVSFYESTGTCSAASTLVGTVSTDPTGTATYNWTTTTLAAGTYNICAFSAQTTISSVTYLAASSGSKTLTIANSATNLAWTTAPPASATYNTTFTPAATSPAGAGHSPCTISYGVSGGACNINNGNHQVTMISGGGLPPGSLTCTVTASIAACTQSGTTYGPATLSAVVTPLLATQTTLVLHGVPGTANDGATFTVSTTGGSGSGAVTYSTSTPTVCSVSGTTVTMAATGTGQICTVTATKASDGNYASATSASASATSNGTAVVTITNTSQTFTGSPLPVTVTTAPPGLSVAVTYSGGTCGGATDLNCPTQGPTLVGTYSVTAMVTNPGVTGSANATETVSQTSAALTLALQNGTSSPSPYGTTDYFVLTLSSCTPGSGPTGTVQLVVDGNPVAGATGTLNGSCTAVVLSTATIEESPLAHQVSVQYAGDTNHPQGNSNTVNLIVSADTTQVALTVTATQITVGQPDTFTATVTPVASLGSGANGPQGTVQFLDGSTVIDTEKLPAASPYTVSYIDPSLTSGTHNITAVYVPGTDQEFAGSSSAVQVTTVLLIAPTITWTAPQPIVIPYGTPLSSAQLEATATDPTTNQTVLGTFVFTPAAGYVLGVGTPTLSVTFTPDPSVSSTYSSQTSTLQITVTAVALTVTADPQTMVYGATVPALTYTITGFVAGDVPSQVTGTASCSITGTTPYTVSGSPYTISCTQGTLAEPNYTFTPFVNGQLTVTVATPTLTLLCPAANYDGNPHGCEGLAIGADGSSQVAGNWTYSPGNATAVGSYPETGTFVSSDPDYFNGGTSNNGQATATLIISDGTSSVTLTCPPSVPYNGAPQTPCTASATLSGGQTVTGLTVTYTNNTNAGTASASATYAGDTNHTGSNNSVNFAIAPAAVTVTGGTYSGTYTGGTPAIPTCTIGGSYTTGLTCTETPTTAGPDVGTGSVVPTLNYNGLNSSNYTLISTNGSWTITPATPTVTVTCTSYSVVYNGAAQTPCSATVTGPGGLDLTNYAVGYTNNIDVGTATATANYPGTNDYAPVTSSVNFAITTAAVTATAGSYTGTFDNAQHAPSACVISGAAIGVSTLSCTNNPTLVGPPVGGPTAIVPVVSGGNPADFTVTLVNGSYTISKATSTVTVTCPPSEVYNGAAQTPACTATVTGADLNQAVTPVTFSNNINVGTATASATFAGDTDHAGSTGSTTFQITTAAVTVTAGSYTGFYTGTSPTIPACQITGVLFATGLTCTNNPTNAGPGLGTNQTVTPQVSGDTSNFTITPVNGSWTISAQPETVNITGGLAQNYNNGNPVAAVTTTTTPLGGLPVTVLYGTTANPSSPTSTTPPSAVGSYAVLATISNADYSGSTTGTLVISAATANLTLALRSGTSEPSLYGTTVYWDLTLTGSPCPTGTVQWYLDGATSGGPVTLPATCTTPVTYQTDTLTPGSHTVYAVFTSGDGDYTGGTSNSVSHSVSANTTTVSLTGPNTANVDVSVTFTAYVVPMANPPGTGALVPAGTVQFYNDGTPIGSPVGVVNVGTGLYVATLSTSFAAQGTYTITATYVPSDGTEYPGSSGTLSGTVSVGKVTPTITWPTPGSIIYGTQLSATQLNASATDPNTLGPVLGSFAYTPAAGALVPAGLTNTLSVTFTPTNTTEYATVTTTVNLVVTQAVPTLSLSCPVATYNGNPQQTCVGTATTTIPGGATPTGTWTYSPTNETEVGTYSVTGTFTSASGGDYQSGTATGTLTINKAVVTATAGSLTGVYNTLAQSPSACIVSGNYTGSLTCTNNPASVGAGVGGPAAVAPVIAGSSQTDFTINMVNGSWTITKATPTVTTPPTASALTYGQTLAASTLTGGSVLLGSTPVPGTFAWTAPTTVPPPGADSESVIFTPTDTTDYNTVTFTVTVTVGKATPTVTTLPTASAITYGQALSASTLTGGVGSVAGSFAWTTPATVPPAGTDSESVTFTPTNTTDYNTVTVTVSVTVRRATPTVTTLPTASALTYGEALSASTLTGGAGSVPGGFTWTTPTTVPPVGSDSESVTFTPTDTADYNTVTATVTVTVSKATPTVSAWPTASALTFGQALSASTLTGGTASVPGTFAWTTPATVPPLGATAESVTFTPTNTTDYSTVTSTVTVTVGKATPTVTTPPTASALTFGQALSSSTLTGGVASVAGTFAWTTPTTVPPLGTTAESVTFTPTNTTDYNTVTLNVSVTVGKATPTVTTPPTASALTFGQTLSSSTLTGGVGSVAGTFAWTTPTTVPPVGTDSESVTFTPTNTTDYNTVTLSVSVTVSKGTPTVTTPPTASALTFGQTLSSSTLTGGVASVAGSFAWTTPTTVPPLGATSESVTFTPTNTTDYSTVTLTVTVTVGKATPTVTTLPTASALTYGQTLASSTLTGGTASVAGTFAWTTPGTVPPVGTPSESVTFTPSNTTDYNTVTISVTVTVSKATPTVTTLPTAGALTYGQALSASTLTGGVASVPGAFAWTTPGTVPPLGSSSQSVTFTPTNTTDYNTVTVSVSVTVGKATPTVTTLPTASALTYGQTLASSTLTGGVASVPGTFAWTTPATVPPLGTSSQSVTFTPTNTTDYNTVTVSVSVTVGKATPTVTTLPTASALTFGQTLSSSTLTGGIGSVPGAFSWTTPGTVPPVGTDSESVTFTPTDTTDYNTVTVSVSVTVSKATPTVTTLPTASALTYGQALSASTLTGGIGSVPGAFSWTTPGTIPPVGTDSESVTFTPTDTTDYNTVTISVSVTVSKATPTVTTLPTASALTFGQTLSSSTLTGGIGSVPGVFSWTTPGTVPPVGADSESVTFTPTDTTDYNTVTVSVTVTVSKATPTVTTLPTASALTYGQPLSASTLTGGIGSVPACSPGPLRGQFLQWVRIPRA